MEERDLLLSAWHPEAQFGASQPASEEQGPDMRDGLVSSENGHDSGQREILGDLIESEEDELDVTQFISINESGNPETFGPSSALHAPPYSSQSPRTAPAQNTGLEHRKNALIANAALQRQAEHNIAAMPDIAGVPTELALHLLDVHWARQHHTFLLTYRPAVMRDLQLNGPYYSEFLLNSIFACSSKFSEHAEGQQSLFLNKCDQLLAEQALLMHPTIPTVVGLLLLGSTYNARGETSKGWLLTGYALRMVYDLGLHLDPQETTDNAEEIEIRRRVFWGAFICDKLQSLYLGRPPAINVRDCQVSREFLDTFEEMEAFTSSAPLSSSMYSVSTFRQLCSLSKIMTVIINRFYAVGATFSNALSSLQMVESALQKWEQNLPTELDVQLQLLSESPTRYPAPNVLNLHALYQSLIILLHRPFISDGHLRAATVPLRSWEQCTLAAGKISAVARCYKQAYGLFKAPYIMAYCIYVASTIHVRNVASEGVGAQHASLLTSNLDYLEEMCSTNPGVKRPASIIRKLISANHIDLGLGELFPADHHRRWEKEIQLTASDKTDSPSQPASQFDLEFIFGTFPGTTDLLGHGHGQGQVPHGMALDIDSIVDPLFGLMGGPMIPTTNNLPDTGDMMGDGHIT